MAKDNWQLFSDATGGPMLEFADDGWPYPFEVWTPDQPNVRVRQAKDGTWYAYAYKHGGPVLWLELPPLPEG